MQTNATAGKRVFLATVGLLLALAPFAYYRLMLFDVARGAVVGEGRVAASRMYLVAGSGETDPWDLVSAKQKVDDLEQLLNQNTGDALKRLTAARARG
jgi:hypothetical protein